VNRPGSRIADRAREPLADDGRDLRRALLIA
jgi:hypothetical protein